MACTYYITTLGCPKNRADSRAMEKNLLEQGFFPAVNSRRADYHLINSCAFIEDARLETIQTVLEAADLKKKHPAQKLVLVGCFSERYFDEVQTELREVDYSFGVGTYHRAGELLSERFGPAEGNEIGVRTGSIYEQIQKQNDKSYAPVKISDGCSRTCTFCAIPLFRGKFQERAASEIWNECRELSAAGVREICLVSQDTNAFGGSPEKFLDLLSGIEEVEALRWVRLLYMYPDLRTQKIIAGIAKRGLTKVVPYLESPLQHVSKKVLRAMKRSGDYDFFKELFFEARQTIPHLEIRTSFLVGFPGEETVDFELLLQFLREVRPEKLALFAYSPEEGTPGYSLTGGADREDVVERINILRNESLKILKEIHRERVGRVYSCMVDEHTSDATVVRRPQDAPEADEVVYLPKDEGLAVGDILPVEITGFYEYDMAGAALSEKIA